MAAAKWVKRACAFAALSALAACANVLPQETAAPTVPVVAPPAPKPLPPAPPKLSLADLASFAPPQMESIFGAPSLKRAEGEMTLLQFTSGSCITDMVFNASAMLVHVEARAKTGTPIEIQPCLDSFSQTLPQENAVAASGDSAS